jgi:plasmid stabilization system protein ParE
MPIEISREAHEDIAGIYAWIAQDDAAAGWKVKPTSARAVSYSDVTGRIG